MNRDSGATSEEIVDRLYEEWLHAQAAYGKESKQAREALDKVEKAVE